MTELVDLSGGDIAIAPGWDDLPALDLAGIGTHYAPGAGLEHLRQTIAGIYNCASTENVVVTTGASAGLTSIFAALRQLGNTALIPQCAYPGFSASLRMLGMGASRYTIEDGEFMPPITERPACVVVNSPLNPTGEEIPSATVDGIVRYCARTGAAVVIDSVYDALNSGGSRAGNLFASRVSNTFEVSSLSKSLAMAGWRLGYVISDKKSCEMVARSHYALAMSASLPAQHFARSILHRPDLPMWRGQLAAAIQARRKDVTSRFARFGVACTGGVTPFAWMDLQPLGLTAEVFCRAAARGGVVCVASGNAFTGHASTFIRVNLAAAEEEVFARAMDWIERLFAAVAARRATCEGS